MVNWIRGNIFVGLLAYFSICAYAQDIQFNNISVENGMLTNEIHDVFQDIEGNMWFATNLGVCKYDGYHFTNFTTKNGLAHNVVFQIEEYNDRIYFNTFKGGVFYLDNDTILSYRYNHLLLDKVGNGFIQDFIVEDDILWFNVSNANGLYLINSDGVLEEYSLNNRTSTFYIKEVNESIICGFADKYLESDNVRVYRNNEVYVTIPTIKFDYTLRPHLYENNFAYGKNLVANIDELKPNSIVLDKRVTSLFVDQNHDMWVGTLEGVLLFSNSDINSPPKKYLQGKTISDIFEDSQGNIWFSTTERGVYFIKPNKGTHFKTGEKIMVLKCSDDIIYCGTDKGKVYKIEDNTKEIVYSNPSGFAIKDICIVDSSNILVNYQLINHFTQKQIKYNSHTTDVNNIYTSHNDYFVTAYNGFKLFNELQLVYESETDGFVNRVKRLLSFSNDSLVILSHSGLHLFSDDVISDIDIEGIDELEITAFCKWGNQLLVSTKTHGVCFVDSTFSILRTLNENSGLSSDHCWAISVANNNIYIGNNHGVDVISHSGTDFNVTNFDSSNLLHYNRINCITNLEDLIVVGTDYGVEIFRDSSINYYFNTTVISDFKVNKVSQRSDDLSFSYDDNNIDISFVSPNYGNEVVYQYRLKEASVNWSTTKKSFINFSKLSPGKYTFEVQPFVNHQMGDIASVSFTINPHFTKTWWFLLGCLILIACATYKIVLDIKLKETYKRKAIQSTQKALRAQMNPHFLFNALNSIQSYILINETELSVKYLNKFAALVRQVLDNSMHDYVAIKDDLSALESYIQLEEIRFEDKFDYEIKIDKRLDIHTYLIPPLLLQPIIENAIWHGLLHKKNGGGKITISFGLNDENIICTVADNGVGKELAENLEGVKSYKSVGLKITKERVNTLNSNSNDKFQIKIRDLYKGQVETGTLVELTIPILKTH